EAAVVSGVGSGADISPADQAALAFQWSVTKNGAAYAGGAGANPSFTPDDNGTYVVTLTATDPDGGTGTATATVNVTNVAPTVALAGDASGVRGQTLNYSGSFADPGSADTWAATVDYGDGSGPQPLALKP